MYHEFLSNDVDALGLENLIHREILIQTLYIVITDILQSQHSLLQLNLQLTQDSNYVNGHMAQVKTQTFELTFLTLVLTYVHTFLFLHLLETIIQQRT